MQNGLVDFVDGRLEALAGKPVIAREAFLEGADVLLEIAHVDLLVSGHFQLLAVLEGIERRIAQKRDDGNKELRADDVHLFVFVGYVHNAVVVQLVVNLQQGDEHCVFAFLFAPVLVQLFEEVLVFVLCGRLIHLVFHFKHDGDKLHPVSGFPEDEIPLAAAARVVVLFKIGLRERRHAQGVELVQTVLLQAFANHFRGLVGLEVLVIFNQFVLLLQFAFVFPMQGLLLQRALRFLAGKAVFEAGDFRLLFGNRLFLFPHRLGNGQLFFRFAVVQLGLQRFDSAGFFRQLVVLLRKSRFPLLLFPAYRLRDRQLFFGFGSGKAGLQLLDQPFFFRQLRFLRGEPLLEFFLLLHLDDLEVFCLHVLQSLFPLLKFPIEFFISNLLDDLRVAGFVHQEGLSAVGTFDLLHLYSSFQHSYPCVFLVLILSQHPRFFNAGQRIDKKFRIGRYASS